MSNDLTEKPQTDMTPDMLRRIEDFEKSGKPGVSAATAERRFQAMSMYMDGCSYSEISSKLQMPKVVLFYLSNKEGWFGIKEELHRELAESVMSRVATEKLEGFHFVANTAAAIRKMFQEKYDRYNRTKDVSVLETLDYKVLTHYFKALDTLDTIGSKASGAQKSPSVQVNVGPNATITQKDDNTVEVSAQSSSGASSDVGAVLKMLAELNRKREEEEEKQNQNKKREEK